MSTGSTDNVVAVIDTGVDFTHTDLASNMWSAPSAFTVTVAGRAITCPAGSHGFNAMAFQLGQPANVVCSPADDNSHGTHVAGTIGATGDNGLGVAGINWTTRIMALKFLDSSGSGSVVDAINAIDFAIQVKTYFASSKGANVRVLSNSYGGDGYSPAFASAVDRARAADMLFVAAAGNAGTNNDATPFYPASYTTSNVVAVAASGGADERSGYSNYGATSVDLAAPGDNILSTVPGGGYGLKSGTSMATPHVAGAAALVLSGCNLNTSQLKTAILSTADPVPAFAGLTVTGGRLNVDSALRSCATLPTSAMVSPTEGSTFAAPGSISLEATAADPDGIARVEFYAGTTLIGTSLTSPYGGSWTNVAAGSYTLTAKAYDRLGLATVSAPVHVTVGSGGGLGTSATFAGTDTTTQGSWRGVYGGDGYQVVNDTSALPAYATVTPSGAASFTWVGSTSDPRALQKTLGADRIAATWYGDAFTIDVNVTDGAAHALALYLLDWDPANRLETLEVRDAVTNAVLDTRTASGFAGGQYWRWTVSGHIVVRVTRAGGVNAVVSGVFFGGASGGNVAPTVGLTGPAEGASYAAPATVALSANASDADGIDRVEFYQGTTLVATSANTSSPYTATWTNVPAGSYTLTAKAYDRLGLATVSAPVHVTVGSGGGLGTSATFAGTDTTTQGSWRGVYGGDGYQVVNDTSALPAYATVTPSGAASFTWVGSTSDPRALQKTLGADRIAATWYGDAFTIDVNVTDGAAHALALYLLDWDPANRLETLEVRDAVTNAVLDTRTASGFAGGQYWRWTVSGHIVVRVTRAGGVNAVVSGVFFGGASGGNVAPTVGLTGPAEGASYAAPATVALSANASDADGIDRVEFYQGTTLVATSANTSSPYTATWTNVPAGSYTLTAKAYDRLGLATVSAPVHVTVGSGGGLGTSATFAGTDTTTQGSWRGVYGGDGYQVVNDTSALPAYATVTPSGAASFTWVGSTSDPRALQKTLGADRIAATWYGDAFTIDVNVTDGAAHALALYLLDWDPANRLETLEVRDAVTNAVLDTRTASGFAGGQYWRWTVSGHIVVRVTRAGGVNAVVSGVFFNP